MTSTNGHAGYRLEMTPRAGLGIERLRDRAIARRLSKSYAEDIDATLLALARNPHKWGRSVADYGTLGVSIRHGRSDFLSLEVIVDDRLREVQVRRVGANPRGPLA